MPKQQNIRKSLLVVANAHKGAYNVNRFTSVFAPVAIPQ